MKKIMLLLSMLILMIGMASIASANTAPTCTINIPASSTAYNGTINFNATLSDAGEGDYNVTSINFSTTGDGSVGLGIGVGVNATSYQVSIDTSSLITDVKQTTVTANIYVNSTGSGQSQNGSCTSTSVDFDNTDPTCTTPLTLDFPILEVLHPLSVRCDASDTTDLTIAITVCTSDGTCTPKTSSSGVTSYEATFVNDETGDLGEATVGCVATDEVSKTCSPTNSTITIKGDGDAIVGAAATKGILGGDKSSMALMIAIGIGALVVLLIVVFFVMKKKK